MRIDITVLYKCHNTLMQSKQNNNNKHNNATKCRTIFYAWQTRNDKVIHSVLAGPYKLILFCIFCCLSDLIWLDGCVLCLFALLFNAFALINIYWLRMCACVCVCNFSNYGFINRVFCLSCHFESYAIHFNKLDTYLNTLLCSAILNHEKKANLSIYVCSIRS